MIRRIASSAVVLLVSTGSVAAQPAPAPGRIIQPLPVHEAAGILGRSVRGPNGEDIGRIIDVIVDQNANPRAAVIDVGGFMGIGNRKIAVDWSALHFLPGSSDNPVTLQMSLNDIKSAPEYRPDGGTAPTVVAPAAAAN